MPTICRARRPARSSVTSFASNCGAIRIDACGLPRLIEMFRRPDRVTIAELVKVFRWQVRTPPVATALGDRIFVATHRLADLEAFQLRMVKVERLVLAGVPMGKTECFRLGPGFERRLALPYRV